MFKPFIRLFSFFSKEINEVRRQPRLILSLLLGPFLILLLFGIGYQSNQPLLRMAIVLPPGGIESIDVEELRATSDRYFELVSIDEDREAALQRLAEDEVDIVQFLPSDIEERALRGEQSPVEFIYSEHNPLNVQWIEYLAYAEVVEINRAILRRATASMQAEAKQTSQELGDMRQQLEALEADINSADTARLRASIQRLRQTSGALALSALVIQTNAGGVSGAEAREDLNRLQEDLDALDQAVSDGTLDQQREEIRSTRERVARMEQVTAQLSALPPDVIVSPLQQQYQNISSRSYDLMTYYAPNVLALLVQHIAVTLGSLSLVRERLLGATEIFRVAPVWTWQVLVGKYLGYTIFITFIVAALFGLMQLLGIPLLGGILLFVGLVLMLTLAALGIGFFISSISRTDSQAIQLSMLVLLLSIFFSGFFLPLENFWPPVRIVGYTLPLTHGIIGMQSLMLQGSLPPQLVWTGLTTIAAATGLAALVLSRRHMRQVAM